QRGGWRRGSGASRRWAMPRRGWPTTPGFAGAGATGRSTPSARSAFRGLSLGLRGLGLGGLGDGGRRLTVLRSAVAFRISGGTLGRGRVLLPPRGGVGVSGGPVVGPRSPGLDGHLSQGVHHRLAAPPPASA